MEVRESQWNWQRGGKRGPGGWRWALEKGYTFFFFCGEGLLTVCEV